MTSESFNLAEEPFVPVVTHEGPELVSLRDALANAHKIIGVDLSDPTAAVSLYRLLLAAALDIHGQPAGEPAWQTLFQTGRFDVHSIDRYFVEHRERFDLFGDHPFYQVPNLEPSSGVWKSVSLLLPPVATGNNVPLFTSMTEDALPPLSFREAAVLLVACMGWDTAAIKTGALGDSAVKGGKTTGNPTGNLGQFGAVIPLGKTLFDTIVLNMPIGPEDPADLPAWRRDWTPQWSQHQPKGVKELLTWQSRRIRLQSEDGLVTAVTLCAGDRLLFTPPHLEPHCLWRRVKPGEGADVRVSQRPIRHKPGHAAWRGMNALLALRHHEGGDDLETSRALRQIGWATPWLGNDYPLDALCVGVLYGNQSAVIEDVMADSVPLPVKALRDADGEPLREHLLQMVEIAEKVRKALNDLDANIRRAEGGESVPWDKGVHPGDEFMPQLDAPTLRTLQGLRSAPDLYSEGMAAWQRSVWNSAVQLANDLLDGASASAIVGHKDGNRKDPLRLSDAEGIFWNALVNALPEHDRIYTEGE